jgi:antitoxin PrlF
MAELLARATLRDKAQVTLPADVRAALHVEPGDELQFAVDAKTGIVTVSGLKTIRADQAWFWDVEWQAGEAEASADLAAGRSEVFRSAEEFLESLAD